MTLFSTDIVDVIANMDASLIAFQSIFIVACINANLDAYLTACCCVCMHKCEAYPDLFTLSVSSYFYIRNC